MAYNPATFDRVQLATLTATATVQLVFAFKNSPEDWRFQRVPLYDGLQEDFRLKAEAAAIDLRDNRAPRPYDPEWELGEHEYFPVSNDPPVGGNFFPQLVNFAGMPQYQQRGRTRSPNAWAILAQLDGGTIATFGARITARSVLDRTNKILRAVFRGDAFDELDDTVISFKPSIDWIVWQQSIAVIDSKEFHAVFRDVPALLAMVDAHLAEVIQHVPINGLDAFADRIKTNPAMTVKLSRIIERADMHTRPAAVLRRYGEDYDIAVDWSNGAMVFDGSVERQWNILRLLDEARTLGPVTGKKWDTGLKTEV